MMMRHECSYDGFSEGMKSSPRLHARYRCKPVYSNDSRMPCQREQCMMFKTLANVSSWLKKSKIKTEKRGSLGECFEIFPRFAHLDAF